MNKHSDITKLKTVLEIGCGAGGIIYYFQKQGCDVTGIDLGSEYLNYGRDKGLNLIHGSSDKLVSENLKFDIIILSHVLEHFLDIGSELNIIRELLKPTSLLYVELPGIGNIKYTYGDLLGFLQNAHIRHFTLGTLSQIMSWNHFKLIVGDESIKSIFQIDYNNDKSEIINYYPEIMKILNELDRYSLFFRTKNAMLRFVLSHQYLHKFIASHKHLHNFLYKIYKKL